MVINHLLNGMILQVVGGFSPTQFQKNMWSRQIWSVIKWGSTLILWLILSWPIFFGAEILKEMMMQSTKKKKL